MWRYRVCCFSPCGEAWFDPANTLALPPVWSDARSTRCGRRSLACWNPRVEVIVGSPREAHSAEVKRRGRSSSATT